MNLLDFFRERKKKETPANIAKERLQIIVAHERGQRTQPDYLPALQKPSQSGVLPSTRPRRVR